MLFYENVKSNGHQILKTMKTPQGQSKQKTSNKYAALKALLIIGVGAYFTYVLYWFAKTIPWMIQITTQPENFFPPAGLNPADPFGVPASYLMEYAGFAGLAVRLVGACFALLAVYLFFRGESIGSLRLRNATSKALLLEGIHFVSFIPAFYYLTNVATLPLTSRVCLFGTLGIQLVLIAPTLILLSRKLSSKAEAVPTGLIRMAAIAALSYVLAMWGMYWFKWTEMAALEGLEFLIVVPRIVAFGNTAVIFSLSAIFAILGTRSLLHKADSQKATRWWGLSTVFLSTHIIVFVLFCIGVNAAFLAIFGELWIIPLVALGAYMLFVSFRKPKVKA
jgi:hypothetical protein